MNKVYEQLSTNNLIWLFEAITLLDSSLSYLPKHKRQHAELILSNYARTSSDLTNLIIGGIS